LIVEEERALNKVFFDLAGREKREKKIKAENESQRCHISPKLPRTHDERLPNIGRGHSKLILWILE
jgi:hypothetical protein